MTRILWPPADGQQGNEDVGLSLQRWGDWDTEKPRIRDGDWASA